MSSELGIAEWRSFSRGEQKPMVPLRAGPFTAWFDVESGFLRYVRIGDHEVVRAIYGAVRDSEWRTVYPEMTNVVISPEKDSFRISFDAVSSRGRVDFSWKCVIEGSQQGVLHFDFNGVAGADFLKNRIGVCVLHPVVECAGKGCHVETVDGGVVEGSFPKLVSPNHVFLNIRTLRYEPVPGFLVKIEFEGETFEMEDQRNWSDASFKTYSTPQALGWPRLIQKGTRVDHRVTLRCESADRPVMPIVFGRPAQLSISTVSSHGKLNLGVQLRTPKELPGSLAFTRLAELRLGHLHFEENLFGPKSSPGGSSMDSSGLHADLWGAFDVARLLGVKLHLSLRLGEEAEARLRRFAEHLKAECARLCLDPTELPVGLWIILHREEASTNERWLKLAQSFLGGVGATDVFAGGSDEYFAELNRSRPPEEALYPHVYCFPASPQVHNIDRATLIENLGALPHNVETAWAFGNKQVLIAPVRLKPRDRCSLDVAQDPETVPSDFDPRQLSLFGAAWLVSCLAKLSVCQHLYAATIFETVGWHGLIGRGRDSGASGASLDGSPESIVCSSCVYPVYHVFADFAEGERFYPIQSTLPLDLEGFCFVDKANRKRVVLANLKDEKQVVRIKTGTCRGRVRMLDERSVLLASNNPEEYRQSDWSDVESSAGKVELELWPYAVARLDLT